MGIAGGRQRASLQIPVNRATRAATRKGFAFRLGVTIVESGVGASLLILSLIFEPLCGSGREASLLNIIKNSSVSELVLAGTPGGDLAAT